MEDAAPRETATAFANETRRDEDAEKSADADRVVRRVGFCRNGVWQGAAFEPPDCAPITSRGAFHPSVSLYTHGKVGEHQDAKVAFNFGPTFVFPVSTSWRRAGAAPDVRRGEGARGAARATK